MFPVETFELFQQFHSMLLFSPVPRCLVLVIGTNSNRKNGKENNAKTSSARGILRQHRDLISITSAQGRAILQQGMDPLLESVPLGWGSCPQTPISLPNPSFQACKQQQIVCWSPLCIKAANKQHCV